LSLRAGTVSSILSAPHSLQEYLTVITVVS
jgi:hypothetical protein